MSIDAQAIDGLLQNLCFFFSIYPCSSFPCVTEKIIIYAGNPQKELALEVWKFVQNVSSGVCVYSAYILFCIYYLLICEALHNFFFFFVRYKITS